MLNQNITSSIPKQCDFFLSIIASVVWITYS